MDDIAMSRPTTARRSLPALLLGIVLALSSAASAQIVGYNPSFYRPVAPQPQRGPPCGHYLTPACPSAAAANLPDVEGGSGQDLWVQGSERLQGHDAQGAAAYFKRSAELGDPRGEASFGQALMLGRGVERDPATGLDWLRRSADSGDRGGEFALGELYANGRYVQQDSTRAAQLYAAGARQRFGPAERKLGVAYELGAGVPRSRANAIAWLERASADSGGDAWPRQVAGFLGRSGTPRFSSEPQLFAAFDRFVANGSAGYYRLPPPRGGGLGYGNCTGPYASSACAHSAFSGAYEREHPN